MAGARRARNEGRQRARRSMTSTLPADFAPASRAWMSDKPSWCVDMGPTLLAMTTCDLWLSLARNDVTPKTKVWREGMPYWESLEKVPEFALAMPDASIWEVGPAPTKNAASTVRPPAAPMVSLEPPIGPLPPPPPLPSFATAHLPLPPPPSIADGASLVPPSEHATPAPVVVEHRASRDLPAAPAKRRIFPRLDRRGATSIAFGAAIAFVALTVATTGPVSPRPATSDLPFERPHAAAVQFRAPDADLTDLVRAPSAPSATDATSATDAPSAAHDSPGFPGDLRETATSATAVAPRPAHAPRGPRASDRGQHRAR